MNIAYSYGRFSTILQGRTGKDSERRQVAGSKEWCRRNGYTLADQTFFDKGKSGFKGEHIAEGGELLKFIKLVEDGTIPQHSILILDSWDRFSRLPPSKSLTLFMRVFDAGIKLVFAGSYEQRIIDATLIDREPNVLQFIIGEMIRSHNESAEKSRKVSEALRAKKARMQSGIVAPYNTIPKYFTYVPITNERGEYVHNKNTAIVKELVEGILAGKSLYGMADDLNRRKVKTFRRGFEWSGNSIGQILRNRALIGEFLGNKHFVPPIVDEDTFNRVQNVLANNTKYARGQKGEKPNIFRGIAFCADCGKSMSVAHQVVKDVEYRYLKCSVGGLGRNHTCANKKLIRLDEMELEFFTHFFKKNPYEVVNNDDKAELRTVKKAIQSNEVRLAKLNNAVRDAVALLGTIQADELKDRLEKLEAERTTLKTAIDELNQKAFAIQDAPHVAQSLQWFWQIIYKDKRGELQLDWTASSEERNAIWKDGDIIEEVEYNLAGKDISDKLKTVLDRATPLREKLRLALPSLIGKITVDTIKGQFYVFNRVGKMIYESNAQKSKRNSSERWKASLKVWDTRKINGVAKPVKRKKY